jgi:hypothetical protein
VNHFTDIELHRWRDSGPGTDRERVIAHLAECAKCASRYATAIRTLPLRAEPSVDAQEFIAAGRRIAGRRNWVAPLAAAAVLVIAVAIPMAMNKNEKVPELHFRGGGIQALAPQGFVDHSEVQFVWSSSIAAARYRLQIGDAKETISTTETQSTQSRIPLKAGDYWWMVTAVDANGRPLTTSQRLTFAVRPR